MVDFLPLIPGDRVYVRNDSYVVLARSESETEIHGKGGKQVLDNFKIDRLFHSGELTWEEKALGPKLINGIPELTKE